jgi:hypothetical protein
LIPDSRKFHDITQLVADGYVDVEGRKLKLTNKARRFLACVNNET